MRRNELLDLKSEVSELKKGLSQLERAVGQTGRKADEKADDVKQTLQMIYKLVNGLSEMTCIKFFATPHPERPNLII